MWYKISNEKTDIDKLREELSDLEHSQWSHWAKYMLENNTEENHKRWERQIKTSYEDLSEKEKDSDREWANKVLNIIIKNNIIKG